MSHKKWNALWCSASQDLSKKHKPLSAQLQLLDKASRIIPIRIGHAVHPLKALIDSNCVAMHFCAPHTGIRKRRSGKLADPKMIFWYYVWYQMDILYTLF